MSRVSRFSRKLLGPPSLGVLLAVVFGLYVWSEKLTYRAVNLRHDSFLLADELRHSSDDLTRMVRTYVVTGDPAYKRHYQDILDIRDGKKPRPLDYERIYWDLVLPGGPSPRPNGGEAVTLLELMRRTGFTAEEFSKLAEAKGNSDRLTVPEFEAMKLVESTGADAEANRQKARTMLFDAKYHEAKAAIMRPIDEFMMLVDNRTTNAVRTARNRAMVLRSSLIILALALLLGAIREITARNRAERVLRESEEHFRSLFETSVDAVVTIDLNGCVGDWNPSAERMFGWAAAEIVGQPVRVIVPPSYRSQHDAGLDRMKSGGGSHLIGRAFEMAGLRKDGTEFPLEMSLTEWTLGAGRAFAAIIRDITEREHADAIRDVTYRISEAATIAGSLDELCNRVREILGSLIPTHNFYVALLDEETGMLTFPYFVDETDAPPAPQPLGQRSLTDYVIRTGEPLLGTPEILDDLEARGEVVLVGAPSIEWLGAPLRVSDTTIGAVVVQTYSAGVRFTPSDRDVLSLVSSHLAQAIQRKRAEEERIRLEARLRQSQKMEAIGQLAGGVAHDFNNVLTVISGNMEVLLADTPEGDPKRGSLTDIQKASERAAGLTQQLLAFGRKQMLQPVLVDAHAVILQVQRMLGRLIGEDIEIRTAFSANPSWVRVDSGQLEQVVINFALNARDAMPRGGRITIRTRNVEESDPVNPQPTAGPRLGPKIAISVSDTGTGMTPEVKARIFEPFFTTKEFGKGSGLGLATTFGFVKQSGGDITVESEPGKGTTFTIVLLAEYVPPSARDSSAKARSVPKGTETVLLVEDEDAVRRIVRITLESTGYRVIEARDGNEALEAVRAHADEIHLVVTDVVMPGMSGRDLAERIAKLRPGVGVLFVSGYTDDAVARHGVEAASAFLQKPFSPLVLARKVREVLDRNQTRAVR